MTKTEFQNELTRLQVSLINFAYKLTADKEDAKDLVQDTCVKALKHYDKYSHQSNFKAWTFTILRNTFINNYRRSLHFKTIRDNSTDGSYISFLHKSQSDHPESEYSFKELGNIIEKLDDNFKIPFKMHYAGYKYREIAERLDIKIGTVKSRIFLTRMKLIKQLKN